MEVLANYLGIRFESDDPLPVRRSPAAEEVAAPSNKRKKSEEDGGTDVGITAKRRRKL